MLPTETPDTLVPASFSAAERAVAWYYYAKGLADGYGSGVTDSAATRGGLAAWNATAATRTALLVQDRAAFTGLLNTPTEARLITERTA